MRACVYLHLCALVCVLVDPKNNAGIIAGSTVGALLLVVVVAVGVVFILRRKNRAYIRQFNPKFKDINDDC